MFYESVVACLPMSQPSNRPKPYTIGIIKRKNDQTKAISSEYDFNTNGMCLIY